MNAPYCFSCGWLVQDSSSKAEDPILSEIRDPSGNLMKAMDTPQETHTCHFADHFRGL